MNWIYVIIGGAVLGLMYLSYFFGVIHERNRHPDEVDRLGFPRCDCRDVNDCEKWCAAKERFKRYHQ